MTDESRLDTGDAGGVSTQTPNDVVSVVAARRSTRAFTDRRVDRGLIERAIERAGELHPAETFSLGTSMSCLESR